MLCRVIVGLKEGVRDVVGEKFARKIKSELDMDVKGVRIVNVFTLEGLRRNRLIWLWNGPLCMTPSCTRLRLSRWPAI